MANSFSIKTRRFLVWCWVFWCFLFCLISQIGQEEERWGSLPLGFESAGASHNAIRWLKAGACQPSSCRRMLLRTRFPVGLSAEVSVGTHGWVWFVFLSPLIVGCNLFWSKFFLYVLLLHCHGRRRLWLIGFVCVLAGLERVTPLLLGPPVNPARWCFGPWVMGTAGGHRELVPNPGVIWFLGLRWLSG